MFNPEDGGFEPFLEPAERRVQQALEDYRQGKMVILTDDEDRENEGDLCLAAEKVTPEAVNFMAREGRGLICLTLTEERVDELELPLMVPDNTSRFETAFTVSIESRRGVTTGISAADRSQTIRTAIDPRTRPADLARPGHIFPLRARRGGTLVRAGQTEGSVDLARMAGLYPASVICEIMKDDGSMARFPDLVEFGQKHGIHILTVEDVIRYRLRFERLVHRKKELSLNTRWGELTTYLYETDVNDAVHLLFVVGDIKPEEPVLVRVHTASALEDALGASQGQNTVSLDMAMNTIQEAGAGVLLYLYASGGKSRAMDRGLASLAKLSGDTEGEVPRSNRDPKDIGIGAQILTDIGLRQIRLITSKPAKTRSAKGYGLEVVGHLPLTGEES